MVDFLGISQTNRVPYSNKIGLIVVGFMIFMMPAMVNAQTIDKFGVVFDIEPGLDHVCLYADISNNQVIDEIFPLKSILKDTNIDIDKVTTRLWGYEYLTHDVSRCDTCIVKDCWPFDPNGTIAGCNDIIITDCKSCGNSIVSESRWEWVEKDLISEDKDVIKNELSYQFETVGIKNTATKRYKLCYQFNEIPRLEDGNAGSYGFIHLDINDELYSDFTNSSWWNKTFPFRYPINSNSTITNLRLNVNDTFTPNIWTKNVTGGMFVYCTVLRCGSGLVVIANGTSELDWENASTRTGNNPLDVWDDSAAIVLHLDSKDGTLTYGSSQYNNTGKLMTGAVINETNGVWGDSYYGDGTTDREIQIPYDASWDVGLNNYTLITWFWVSDTSPFQVIADSRDNPGEVGMLLLVNSNNVGVNIKGNSGTWAFNHPFTTTNEWTQIAFTRLKDTNNNTFYVNGIIVDSSLINLGDVFPNNGLFALGGRFDTGNGAELIGGIDEFQIHNVTMNETNIMEHYRNGINSLAPLGEVQNVQPNTSLLAINQDIPDFIFSASDFVNASIINFNTSAANTTFLILSSMNIEKLNPGGTNVITVRIILDSDATILEEDMRTVTGTVDIGSSGTSPVIFSVASGEHNITYQFKRTGPGGINISNFDFNLIQFISNDGNGVRNELVLTDYNHTDTSFTTAFNWTMNKAINSSTFILVRNTLTKSGTGSTTATYFFENLLTGDTSPFWQRFLSNPSDIGSVSGIYIDPAEIGEHNHSIQSRQTDAGDTVFVNGSLVDFDLMDSDGLSIGFFQEGNGSTNLTDSIDLGAGTHLLVESEVLNVDGNGYFITFFSSFSSLSGSQTPRYFIDSPNLTIGQCFTEKRRTLSDNNDIGNAFAYTVCEGLSLDVRYTFRLWVEVGSGETLTQLDESLLGFEVVNFSIVVGQVAPIASIITNPINGSNVTGSDTITWLPFFDLNGDPITYNVTLVNSDGTHNSTIGSTNLTSLGVNWDTFGLGPYFLQVEGCDPGDLCSDTNISIRIIAPPVPGLRPSISFCEDSDILTTEDNTRTITNNVISDEIEITRTVCQYGCSNWTISTFGNPGCEEGDFWLALVFIIVLILVILIIRGAAR